MKGSKIILSCVAAGTLSAALSAQSAQAVIVDVSALNGNGTTISLAAGTYTATFIGTAQGGAYDAYSPWSSNSGCDANGANCSTGWAESIAIDFGSGVGNFNRQDGYQNGRLPTPSDSALYADPLAALAAIQNAALVHAPLPQATDNSAYTAIANPITFTLANAQSVNFFVFDNPYGDNRGGISLQVSSVPAPATVWLFGSGLIGLTDIARRRRKR